MTDLVTYLAPDRFHVHQLMWDDVKEAESGDPMYDEWFMLGSDYYDPFIGAMVAANAADPGALQETGRDRKAMNERIVADAYLGMKGRKCLHVGHFLPLRNMSHLSAGGVWGTGGPEFESRRPDRSTKPICL